MCAFRLGWTCRDAFSDMDIYTTVQKFEIDTFIQLGHIKVEKLIIIQNISNSNNSVSSKNPE